MQQPPQVNGVMTLTAAQQSALLSALQTIKAGFTATDAEPVCDVFYLVATYNKQNPATPINGDTAAATLAGTV